MKKFNPHSRAESKVTKHSAAVTLGRYGGKVGGPARAKVLSRYQRSAIARKGGLARHGKKG